MRGFLLLTALIVSGWATAIAAQPASAAMSFDGGRLVDSGNREIGLQFGDFTEDGFPDVFTANGNGTQNLLINRQDNWFFMAGGFPRSAPGQGVGVVTGDFNDDDHVDAATTTLDNGLVHVVLGDGGGGVLGSSDPSSGASTQPFDIAKGDLDEDGDLDLVTANQANTAPTSPPSVSVLLNNGDGTFASGVPTTTGGNAALTRGLAIGDVTGDDDLDVVAVNSNTNEVRVLTGDGAGGLTLSTTSYSTANGPRRVVLADLDNDTDLDIATADSGDTVPVNPGNRGNKTTVLLNNGSGAFNAADDSPFTTGPALSSPFAVRAADFDGDGNADLAFVNRHNASLSVLHGAGDGSFGAFQRLGYPDFDPDSPPEATDLDVGDINNDGRPDLIGNASGNPGFVIPFLNTTTQDAPTGLTTNPSSPGATATPKIQGSTDGHTINLYTTNDCSGSPVGTGTEAEFEGAGITVAAVPAEATRTYRATTTNAAGWATSSCSSDFADYKYEPRPANDDFADAEALSGASDTTTGTNLHATAQAGEPNPTTNGGGRSVWYSWTAPEASRATVDLAGSAIDTVLGVYTGSAVNSLTTVVEGDDNPDTTALQSKVSFDAASGTTYYFEVDGFSGAEGNLSVALSTVTTGSIAGEVTDYLGNDIEDVCVDAYSAPSTTAGTQAHTNEFGIYELANLPPGNYRVGFSNCTTGDLIPEFFDNKADYATADPVTVTPAGTAVASAQLGRTTDPGTISGHVTDTNDVDLEDVCVTASREAPGGGTDAYQTHTAVDGTYTVSVPPDDYTVEFLDCGDNNVFGGFFDGDLTVAEDPDDALPLTVTHGSASTGVDVKLASAGRITGHVTDINGDPLNNICVSVIPDSGPPAGGALTDSLGDYVVDGLRTGDYTVYFSDCMDAHPGLADQFYSGATSPDDADPVSVTAGSTESNISAVMTEGGSISGTVTGENGGGPLELIGIIVYDAASGIPYDIADTDVNGQYEINGLPPGDYKVEACDCSLEYLGEFYENKPDFDSADSVTVTAGDDSPVDFELRQSGAISGTVTDEDGQPLEDICVTGWGEDEFGPYTIDSVNTDAAGTYFLIGFDTGDYKVEFTDCSGPYGDEYYDNRLTYDSADEVATTAGDETSGIDAVLSSAAPVSLTRPRISGNVVVGQALTAVPDAWSGDPSTYAYQWQRCDSDGGSCSPIGGAGQPNYTVLNADTGSTLRVQVTATNSIGSGVATSAKSSLVGVPVALDRPQISGNPVVGQTLASTHATWSDSSASYSYQWLRCNATGSGCSPISGANQPSYAVVGADSGHTLRSQVIATNGSGSGVAVNSPNTSLIDVPAVISLPQTSGTLAVGQTITATHGSWSRSPSSYAYQWLRCNSGGSACSAISGADQPSYVIVGDDSANTLRVQVVATNSSGPSAPANSSATNVIGIPTVIDRPQISGTVAVGQTLTANPGNWSGPSSTYDSQWLRCNATGGGCTPIAGADQATYGVVNADSGHTLRVQVTATNSLGSGVANSPNTSLIDVPAVTSLPQISGTLAVGQTLTATHGSWTQNPSSYAYQWLRCNSSGGSCSAISGADQPSYLIDNADSANTLRVQVTATNNSGPSAAANSSATNVVGAPTSTDRPQISGTVAVGQTLTATHGDWSQNPSSYAYQWLRCNSGGGSCNAISGADQSTYAVVNADLTNTLRVQVVATNSSGPSAPANSSNTKVVGAPTVIDRPQISGTVAVGQTLTANPGNWSGPASTYDYQWLRCNATGGGCSPIAGAEQLSYGVVGADSGHSLRVQVTATNSLGSGVANSPNTSLIS